MLTAKQAKELVVSSTKEIAIVEAMIILECKKGKESLELYEFQLTEDQKDYLINSGYILMPEEDSTNITIIWDHAYS